MDTQYRCHPKIAKICNKLFYNNTLKNGCTAEDRPALIPNLPAVSCIYHTGNQSKDKSGSISNSKEAALVTKTVRLLLQNGIPGENLGVICLYKAQAALIKGTLETSKSGEGENSTDNRSLDSVMVSTVDAFQGAERDIIMISCSCTRFGNNNDFMSQPGRVNVALSRAKSHLLIFGHQYLENSGTIWDHVLQKAEAFRDVPSPIVNANLQDKARQGPNDIVIVDSDTLVDYEDPGVEEYTSHCSKKVSKLLSDLQFGHAQLWEGYKLHALGYLYGDMTAKHQFRNCQFGKALQLHFGPKEKKFQRRYTSFYVEAKAYLADKFGEESVSLINLINRHDDAAQLEGTPFGDHVLKVKKN